MQQAENQDLTDSYLSISKYTILLDAQLEAVLLSQVNHPN